MSGNKLSDSQLNLSGSHFLARLAGWPVQILPSVIITALVIATRGMGGWQMLEWQTLDYFLRSRPAETIDEHIVIVGIGEEDIQQIGSYPIPDGQLAALLRTVKAYDPSVIGLDLYRDLPVEPGHTDFRAFLQSSDQLIAISKLTPPSVAGPEALPPEQIGFADVVVDQDGFVRRSLLGSAGPEGDWHFAFTLRLAETYLAQQEITLENGVRNPVAMRFGQTELSPLVPNTGGYVQADNGGHQVLVNFRSGPTPFHTLSWSQLQSGQFEPEWLRDRIVLIGMTAPSVKDYVNSAAIPSNNPGLIYGIEYQAHAISQIVNAALVQRPLLSTWSDGWEYGWIALWGGFGILVGRVIRKPGWQIVVVGTGSVVLLGLGYGLLLWQGWWIPMVPVLAVFVTNGIVFPLFYGYDQRLRARIQDRQQVIDSTFNTIHNGPLQTLASLLQDTHQDTHDATQGSLTIHNKLKILNQELRDVDARIRQETLINEPQFYLNQHQSINLQTPLHEILYEVYNQTLQEDLSGFSMIKFKIIEFEPMSDRTLSLEDKRNLCQFLQEALQNVGKHSQKATRLTIRCKQTQHHNLIQVADNGQNQPQNQPQNQNQWQRQNQANGVTLTHPPGGYGTQQAKRLSKRLKGEFKRYPNTPSGTVCELIWPVRKTFFLPM